MFSIHGPPHVLQLMFIEHGNKEIGPSSHSVTDKIKLLRLYTGPFHSLGICTCHSNKIWSSLILNIMWDSYFYYQAKLGAIIILYYFNEGIYEFQESLWIEFFRNVDINFASIRNVSV